MGSAQICFYCHRNRQLIIPLMLILVSSFTLVIFMAEGTAITKLLEAAAQEKMVVMKTQTIGSRPPRCDRRCNSCGHCEAVQVPITTQTRRNKRSQFSSSVSTIAYSRGDDVTNYKPMSWKCKCGNTIFNP